MNREVWAEFVAQPQTQEAFRMLKRVCDELSAAGLAESLQMDSIESTALHAARVQGMIDGLNMLLDGDIVEDEE